MTARSLRVALSKGMAIWKMWAELKRRRYGLRRKMAVPESVLQARTPRNAHAVVQGMGEDVVVASCQGTSLLVVPDESVAIRHGHDGVSESAAAWKACHPPILRVKSAFVRPLAPLQPEREERLETQCHRGCGGVAMTASCWSRRENRSRRIQISRRPSRMRRGAGQCRRPGSAGRNRLPFPSHPSGGDPFLAASDPRRDLSPVRLGGDLVAGMRTAPGCRHRCSALAELGRNWREAGRHRSPLVLRCVEDLAGCAYPLELLTHYEMIGRILPFLILVAPVLAEERVEVCCNWDCAAQTEVVFDDYQWLEVTRLIGLATIPAGERALVAQSLGRLYQWAGEQTPIHNDRAGNRVDEDAEGRMDCIDH